MKNDSFNNINKGKRLIRGSALRTLHLGVSLVVSFIMMPVIIHALGNRLYGLWTLVVTFIGYYGLLDFGLSASVERYVSRGVGLKDHKEINDVISTCLFIYLIVGIVAILVTILAAIYCPYFIKDISDIALFRKVIVLMGFITAVGLLMRVFGGLLGSFLRYDMLACTSIIRLVTTSALIYYFLKTGHGILAMVVISCITSLLAYIAVVILSKKVFRQLKIHPFLNGKML